MDVWGVVPQNPPGIEDPIKFYKFQLFICKLNRAPLDSQV